MKLAISNHIIQIDKTAWTKQGRVELPTRGMIFEGKPCDVTWRVQERDRTNYVVATLRGVFQLRLHRLLMGAKRGQLVDHRNHNGLDNRRRNLRLVTPKQNSMNRRSARGATSKHVGVSLHKQSGKWQASVRDGTESLHLGLFRTEDEAAEARNEWVRINRPEFGFVNEVAQ